MQYKIIAIVCFIGLLNICNTQEVFDSDKSCNETGNCTRVSHCISKYSELNSYIVNNDEILRQLVETFFDTGKAPSKYVKITYNYLSSTLTNGSNDIVDNNITNCTSHQTTYIWSESILYLLGPKPLFLLTLFAIDIPKATLSIKLPCLCEDVQFELLGRLTHLVRNSQLTSR